jgi:hypothetical protein
VARFPEITDAVREFFGDIVTGCVAITQHS